MSKEPSTSQFIAWNVSKNTHPESNENEFKTSLNPIHFPPPRTPLNTIQDPSQSQSQKDFHDSNFDSHHKLEAVQSTRALDKKLEALDRVGNASHSYVTPRVSAWAETKSQRWVCVCCFSVWLTRKICRWVCVCVFVFGWQERARKC